MLGPRGLGKVRDYLVTVQRDWPKADAGQVYRFTFSALTLSETTCFASEWFAYVS